jgi:peptidoglycan/LPS O-acetylase OafA/YrhL
MNRKLLLLNGLAMLAVVLHHAANRGFTAMFWWADVYRPVSVPNYDEIGSLGYYILLAARQLPRFSVPAFLFVSAVFVAYAARGSQGVLTWKMIRIRIVNLVIPYLIWSLVIFLLEILQGQRQPPLTYLGRLLAGAAVVPFYFVPLLAQLYLLSPFLARWAKKSWASLLAAAAVIEFSLMAVDYIRLFNQEFPVLNALAIATPLWLFTNHILFFILGLVYGLNPEAFKPFLEKTARFLWPGLIAFALLSLVEHQVFTQVIFKEWRGDFVRGFWLELYTLCIIFLFLLPSTGQVPLAAFLNKIGKMSYGIYLSHLVFINLAARAIYNLLPALLAYQVIFVIILFAIGVGFPVLMMDTIVKTPARAAYRYLFG